jgi:hypothetical protein
MRKLMLIATALCVIVAFAHAQTPAPVKVASSWKCAPPNPVHTLPVGDSPDHVYILQQGKCTATKGEIAGIADKEGLSTEFMEATGNNAKGHGMFVETMANGDKVYISYQATGTSANKQFQSGSNTWTVTGGTGKFAGAKGSGSCKGKGNPDGSANFDCTGTVTLAK